MQSGFVGLGGMGRVLGERAQNVLLLHDFSARQLALDGRERYRHDV